MEAFSRYLYSFKHTKEYGKRKIRARQSSGRQGKAVGSGHIKPKLHQDTGLPFRPAGNRIRDFKESQHPIINCPLQHPATNEFRVGNS